MPLREIFGLTWWQRRVPFCCLRTVSYWTSQVESTLLSWPFGQQSRFSCLCSILLALAYALIACWPTALLCLPALLADLVTLPWQLRASRRWARQAADYAAVRAALEPEPTGWVLDEALRAGYCASCRYRYHQRCTAGKQPGTCYYVGQAWIDTAQNLVRTLCPGWRP